MLSPYSPITRDNYDNESSDDDNDDDVEKDEEDEEEEEHLAPADPSTVPTDSSSPNPPTNTFHTSMIHETMITVNQGMSVEEIERVVAQRVANAIEAIPIMRPKNQHGTKVNKADTEHMNAKAYTAGSCDKKTPYGGDLDPCDQSAIYHHDGPLLQSAINAQIIVTFGPDIGGRGEAICCLLPKGHPGKSKDNCYECGNSGGTARGIAQSEQNESQL
ncbi:hypothetical protein Tco_0427410 [Tanacetum coccineum]